MLSYVLLCCQSTRAARPYALPFLSNASGYRPWARTGWYRGESHVIVGNWRVDKQTCSKLCYTGCTTTPAAAVDAIAFLDIWCCTACGYKLLTVASEQDLWTGELVQPTRRFAYCAARRSLLGAYCARCVDACALSNVKLVFWTRVEDHGALIEKKCLYFDAVCAYYICSDCRGVGFEFCRT